MSGGAVAYLTHSPYGRNGNEITINNSSDYITGNAGGSVSADKASGTTNAYDTVAGMLASTTGNITGIYDMSGGANEYIATWNKNSKISEVGYVDNYYYGSNFASKGGSSTKYATAYNGDDNPEPSSSRCVMGDALYEVYVENNDAWFNDSSLCPYSTHPFFARGGVYLNGMGAGVFCSYDIYYGAESKYNSFRVCLPGG